MESCHRESCELVLMVTIWNVGTRKRREKLRDDGRCSDGYHQAGFVFNYQGIAASVIGIAMCGSGCQYFSDCDIHSRADTYFCAEDYLRLSFFGFVWKLDDDGNGGIYDTAVGKFWPIHG